MVALMLQAYNVKSVCNVCSVAK